MPEDTPTIVPATDYTQRLVEARQKPGLFDISPALPKVPSDFEPAKKLQEEESRKDAEMLAAGYVPDDGEKSHLDPKDAEMAKAGYIPIDPVKDQTLDELKADKEFEPVSYLNAHEDMPEE